MSNIFKPNHKLIIDPSAVQAVAEAHHEMQKPGSHIMSGVLARFEFDVTAPDGEVLSHIKGPSFSFLRNFGRFMRQIFIVTSNTNDQVTDTGGVARTISVMDTGSGNFSPIVPGATAQFRFGSSSTAVASDQYDVQTFITNAETPNTTTTVLIEDGTQLQFQVDGAIQNTSGGAWSVAEMVLCAHIYDASNIDRQVAMLRDVFAPTNVPDLSTANGHYVISIPV